MSFSTSCCASLLEMHIVWEVNVTVFFLADNVAQVKYGRKRWDEYVTSWFGYLVHTQ